MFEDSTFDSTGRIHTRSRGWMLAALALNGSILLAMVLIPLIYPEALPRQALSILLEAPTPPPAQQPAPKAPARMERLTTRPKAPSRRHGRYRAPSLCPTLRSLASIAPRRTCTQTTGSPGVRASLLCFANNTILQWHGPSLKAPSRSLPE